MEEKFRQQESDCLKVVLFGPESSGKTTLSKQLAAYYKTNWVPEYSRIYAEEKILSDELLAKNDVLPIAEGQISLENKITKEVSELLICDTDLLETKIYSEYLYNYCPEELRNAVEHNSYDLYILTDVYIPWQPDPVRSLKDNRKEMFQLFKAVLDKNKLPYIIVSGNKEDRLNTAISQIDKLLCKKV